MLFLKILAIFITLFAARAGALTLQGGPLGLGARSMGMGGAVVALPGGAESMFWNPAGLGGAQGFEILGAYGSGGNFGPQREALSLGLELPGGASFALAAEDGKTPGAAGLHQSGYLAGLGLELGHGVSLGTNQKFLSADPGGLGGWSMDAGLQAALGSDFRLGLAFMDVASTLVWNGGREEELPGTAQGGAAWSPFYGTWISAQGEWADQNGVSRAQWRAGLESAWHGRAFILRLGATQASGGELFATAGLGSSLRWGSTRLSLDGAWLQPADSNSIYGSRSLLSLGLVFGAKAQVEAAAAMAKVLKDPRTGKIHRATIGLVADEDVRDWNMQITDKQGRVIRTFKGKGAVPPSLSWDGKSDQGKLMDGEGLSYVLRTVSHAGTEKRRHELLGLGGPAAAALGAMDDSGVAADDFGLRQDGKPGKASRVKPALKGSGEFEIQGAEFDLSDVPKDAGAWELRIVDDQGKVVKKFSGQGKPPQSLKWGGSNDLGAPVDMGLGGSFVLRVEDSSGRSSERGADLVSPDDFSRIAKSRGLPGADASKPRWCRKDGRGGWICELPFAPGSAELDDDAWKAVGEAVKILGRGGYQAVEIAGYAKKGEAKDALLLSQARAENALKAVVEGYELKTAGVSAKGYGESDLGRKAELNIHKSLNPKE
jgi:flagellar hook assembly protein FlgD